MIRTLKSLLPVILLLLAAAYAFHHYDQLPRVVLNAVIFLPVVLVLAVLALSVHFNRSPLFFYAVIIGITNIVLGMGLSATPLSSALLAGLMPVVLASIALMPDRGIFSIRAIPTHLVILAALLFALLMIRLQPVWLNEFLFADWAPARYFDWTGLTQTVIVVALVAVLSLLVTAFVSPGPLSATALGVLILLIVQLHAGDSDRSLNVFSSAALLLCLYAILQESWRMAYIDELTELPARRALRERFQKIGRTYSVAMLDVDHFKKFNDTYGHDTGDAVLRMIAAKLGRVGGKGVAYRYGGEEFTVVFKGKTIEEARPYLEELREQIADTPFVVNRASRRKNETSPKQKRKQVQVTISIGVADSSKEGEDAWAVLKQADKALYKAKKAGRNRVSH